MINAYFCSLSWVPELKINFWISELYSYTHFKKTFYWLFCLLLTNKWISCSFLFKKVLQRKKIGLSRRTKRSLNRVNQSESKNRHISSFLQSFKRKECIRYVPDPKSYGRPIAASETRTTNQGQWEKACFCGAPKDEHKTR